MAKTAKAGPVVTDNGNFVIDAPFEEAMFRDPHEVRMGFSLMLVMCFADGADIVVVSED